MGTCIACHPALEMNGGDVFLLVILREATPPPSANLSSNVKNSPTTPWRSNSCGRTEVNTVHMFCTYTKKNCADVRGQF